MPFYPAKGGGKKETEIIVTHFSMYNNGHKGRFNYKEYFDSYEEFAKKATWGFNMSRGSQSGMGWPNGNVKATSQVSVSHDDTYLYLTVTNEFIYEEVICFPKE